MNIKYYSKNTKNYLYKASSGAAGLDIVLVDKIKIYKDVVNYIKTGLYLEIQDNYFGMLVERSSMHKLGLGLANKIGIIDSDYRGELILPIIGKEQELDCSRLVQIIFLKHEIININKQSDIERGTGSFGSTKI